MMPITPTARLQWLPELPLLVLLLLVGVAFLFLKSILQSLKMKKKGLKLPPTPPKLPIIGNLHQLGNLPHQSLTDLSRKYGPVMLLYLGYVPTLVVSSPDTAKEVFKIHDLDTCTRPKSVGTGKLSYGYLDVAFAPYGDYWREMRKFFTVELLSAKQVNAIREARASEVIRLTDFLLRKLGNVVELDRLIFELTDGILANVAFGKFYGRDRFGGKDFQVVVKEAMAALGGFFVEDFFPTWWGRVIDKLVGHSSRLEKSFRDLDGYFQMLLDEHRSPERSAQMAGEDFVDILIALQKDPNNSFGLTDDNIKAVIMNAFLAGTDTSAITILWAMSELMKNPRVMKKVQAEIRGRIGKKDKLEEADIANLKYLRMIIKETLRVHPTTPLLLPRETIRHCRIGGYDVPPGTQIFVNVRATGRDPNSWENPEEFNPERFESTDIDFRGQNFELLPFGSGRRICPAISMGVGTVEFALANMLYWFDWELPEGVQLNDISMEDQAGLTVHRKNPLHIVPIKYQWNKQELQNLHNAGDDSFSRARKVMLENQLTSLYKLEETFWHQRSRVKWINEGDLNTRFFHQTTIQRRAQNKIFRLKDEDDRWVDKEEDVRALCTDFFKSLYTTSGGSIWQGVLQHVKKSVQDEQRADLERPVLLEEIKAATMQLGGTKAPGPDGFSGIFYQSCWTEVGEQVCSAVMSFFTLGYGLESLNNTDIVLVPKVSCPESVSQFRPISLCNFAYKIISKVLVNRLKTLLPSIISPFQSAFIAGRMIHDNIIVAHEAFHYLRLKKKGKNSECALKIDMAKAYDRVEWDFLLAVMRKMGFGEKWIQWVERCIKSVSYSVIVNGERMPGFTPSRGIRQGDPLSPYLFIILADVLSQMIMDAVATGQLKGIKIRRRCPVLSHLFFADDSLLFLKADQRNVQVLKDIIEAYCHASGQMVNLGKSNVYFSANTTDAVKAQISTLLGVESTDDPGRYLGLPVLWGKSKHQALGFIKKRIIEKAQGWKQKLLSQVGREVLIKSVLQAIPAYAMSVFQLPKKWCREVNSIVARFWWGDFDGHRKVHWLSWDELTKPKRDGGMGFKELEVFNMALLVKTAWRLTHEPDAFWVRILKGVYFHDCTTTEARRGSRASWGWSSIWNGLQVLKNNGLWRIGPGNSVNVWSDPWVPGLESYRLRIQVPPYPPTNLTVDKLLTHDGNWNDLGQVSRFITPDEVAAIQRIIPDTSAATDTLIWPHDRSGKATAKSVYGVLKSQSVSVENRPHSSYQVPKQIWAIVWGLNCPPKIRNFMWKVAKGITTTNHFRFRRHCSPSPICNHCPAQETIEHLLLICPWTSHVWFDLLGMRIDTSTLTRIETWWLEIIAHIPDKAEQKRVMELIAFTSWGIWKERSAAIFENRTPDAPSTIHRIRSAVNEYYSLKATRNHVHTHHSPVCEWEKPPDGIIKLNCDASIDPATNRSAIAIIARDDRGWLMGGTTKLINQLDVETAEALAVEEGLRLAIRSNWREIIIETDSALVIGQLNRREVSRSWRTDPVINNIIRLAAEITEIRWRHVRRSANKCADWVATMTRRGMCPEGWVSQPPSPLVDLLLLDCKDRPP